MSYGLSYAGDARESPVKSWGRRAITVPLYFVVCVTVITTSPVLLAIAAIADLFRRSRWAGVRFIIFLAAYFCLETAGIFASFWLWIARVATRTSRERFLDRNFALQQWWAGSLFGAGCKLFSIRVEVEGADELGEGPFIVFIRHVSLGDTLLPSTFLSRRYGIRLRYLLKSQLLWDPCLDIVGNRLPNCFVRRGAGDGLAVSAVKRLMDGLGEKDGVLIYPEGTRFTPEKRERILERLASSDGEFFQRAEALKNVLPPRLGGTLALLEENENAHALFCGHVGLEGVTDFRDLPRGSMVGAVLRVRFWRVGFEDIPKDRATQIGWLFEHWSRVDRWVGEQRGDRAEAANGIYVARR